MNSIDLSWRPQSYFWPLDPKKHALNRVQGTARRAVAARRATQAGVVGFGPLFRPQLDENTRRELGRLHPSLMGGEYLPRSLEAEVEIARIDINSVTSDATCLYAGPGKSRIYYRVVDEYEGDTLSGRTRRTPTRPLTLGEVVDFFLGAWDLFLVLQINFEEHPNPLNDALRFFRGSSAHYPEFDNVLRQRVLSRFASEWARVPDEGGEDGTCA